jgi:hypothetical protein
VRAASGVRDPSNPAYIAGKYSLQCLCQLFVAHPNFNLTGHVVQVTDFFQLKISGLFTQTPALIITLIFEKNNNFFAEKCDHNIAPSYIAT